MQMLRHTRSLLHCRVKPLTCTKCYYCKPSDCLWQNRVATKVIALACRELSSASSKGEQVLPAVTVWSTTRNSITMTLVLLCESPAGPSFCEALLKLLHIGDTATSYLTFCSFCVRMISEEALLMRREVITWPTGAHVRDTME